MWDKTSRVFVCYPFHSYIRVHSNKCSGKGIKDRSWTIQQTLCFQTPVGHIASNNVDRNLRWWGEPLWNIQGFIHQWSHSSAGFERFHRRANAGEIQEQSSFKSSSLLHFYYFFFFFFLFQLYRPCDCPLGENLSSSASGNSSDPGPSRKRRNYRTRFTQEQKKALEKKFQESKYLTRVQRCELGEKIGVSEISIRGWFQNQRTKIGKNAKISPESSSVSSGDSAESVPRTPTPADQPVPDPQPPQTRLVAQEYSDCCNFSQPPAASSHFSHSRQVPPSHYFLPPYPPPTMPYPPPYHFGYYGYNYGHYGYRP